jgi:hypothetical protein
MKGLFGPAFFKQKRCVFVFAILKIYIFENNKNARFRNVGDRNFFKIIGFERKSAISFYSFFKYETPKISS